MKSYSLCLLLITIIILDIDAQKQLEVDGKSNNVDTVASIKVNYPSAKKHEVILQDFDFLLEHSFH